jgi:hypothetical protein
MGVRNKKRETLKRLNSKTLDARFLNEIKTGLNCSPFEAEAVLEVVKEVYFPFLDEQSVKAPPGKVTLITVSADEPAGPHICKLCAGMIMEVVNSNIRSKDHIHHGQIVWVTPTG